MSYTHREERRSQRIVDVLTDETRGQRVIISRLGAELVSLARRDERGQWRGFLYRDDDLSAPVTGWANHATVMGYFLHRLKDGKSVYRGREIAGSTHSFLRQKLWHCGNVGERSISYQITPQDFTSTEYPLRVSLDLTYAFEEDWLRTTFRFRNDEPELTAHVGFGLHPGFGSTSFESFRLEMPAGRYRRWFSPDNYLSGETQEIDFPGGEMPFRREDLPGSFILELVEVARPEFVFVDPPSGREARLDLTGVPYVTLWSNGAAFVCIEPCWGLTDRHEQRPFEEKDGIQTIPPNGTLEKSFRMRVALGKGKP